MRAAERVDVEVQREVVLVAADDERPVDVAAVRRDARDPRVRRISGRAVVAADPRGAVVGDGDLRAVLDGAVAHEPQIVERAAVRGHAPDERVLDAAEAQRRPRVHGEGAARGVRAADGVRAPRAVHRDAERAVLVAVAADVRAPLERRAVGGDAREPAVDGAAEGRVRSARGEALGGVVAVGVSADDRAAQRVDGDVVREVALRAADVAGPEQRGPRRVELGDERVAEGAGVAGVREPGAAEHGERHLVGVGPAAEIEGAVGAHGELAERVATRAAEPARLAEHGRVEVECPRVVVGAEREADLERRRVEVVGDAHGRAVVGPRDGRLVDDLAGGGLHDEPAGLVDARGRRADERVPHDGRVRTGRDDEGRLRGVALDVDAQVDAGPERAVLGAVPGGGGARPRVRRAAEARDARGGRPHADGLDARGADGREVDLRAAGRAVVVRLREDPVHGRGGERDGEVAARQHEAPRAVVVGGVLGEQPRQARRGHDVRARGPPGAGGVGRSVVREARRASRRGDGSRVRLAGGEGQGGERGEEQGGRAEERAGEAGRHGAVSSREGARGGGVAPIVTPPPAGDRYPAPVDGRPVTPAPGPSPLGRCPSPPTPGPPSLGRCLSPRDR